MAGLNFFLSLYTAIINISTRLPAHQLEPRRVCFSASRWRLITPKQFIKAFHFLPKQFSSGRRNNGDACGMRVPLYERKTKKLQQQYRRKVRGHENHRQGLQSRDTGGRNDACFDLQNTRKLIDWGQGLALGIKPEHEDVCLTDATRAVVAPLSLGFTNRLKQCGVFVFRRKS